MSRTCGRLRHARVLLHVPRCGFALRKLSEHARRVVSSSGGVRGLVSLVRDVDLAPTGSAEERKRLTEAHKVYTGLFRNEADDAEIAKDVWAKLGSPYGTQPYSRLNAHAVDRGLALKIRSSDSDGPRGHCAWRSVPRVGQIRQLHRTSSRSSKHATERRSPRGTPFKTLPRALATCVPAQLREQIAFTMRIDTAKLSMKR